jgi:hypothetical protein
MPIIKANSPQKRRQAYPKTATAPFAVLANCKADLKLGGRESNISRSFSKVLAPSTKFAVPAVGGFN